MSFHRVAQAAPPLSPARGTPGGAGHKHERSPSQKTPLGRMAMRPFLHPSPITPTFRTTLTPRDRGDGVPPQEMVYNACNSAFVPLDQDGDRQNPRQPAHQPAIQPQPPAPPPPEVELAPRPPTEQELPYVAKGFTQPEARYIVHFLNNPAIAQQIPAPLTAITSDEIDRYRAAGLACHEMLICKNWGLAVPEYLEFKAQTIRLNQKTTLRGRYTP